MVVPVWKGLEWGNHDVCHKQSKAGGSVDVRCIRLMGMRSLVWQLLVPARVEGLRDHSRLRNHSQGAAANRGGSKSVGQRVAGHDHSR